MSRPAKNPKIRINEIIETAEPLFYSKGYTQTTIADIVNSMGVAPGTIYYYFKSKDAILDAIVNKHVNIFSEQIQLIADARDISSHEKLQKIIRKLFSSVRHTNNKLLFEFLHNNDTLHMLHRIELQSKLLLLEPLCKIIKEGIDEQIFTNGNPTVLANIILALLYSLIVGIYHKFAPDIFSAQLLLTEQLIKQALGSKQDLRIYITG